MASCLEKQGVDDVEGYIDVYVPMNHCHVSFRWKKEEIT